MGVSTSDAADCFEQLDETDSKRLLKPHVPLLVVTHGTTKGTNVMTAAGWMHAGYEPFRYLIAVDQTTLTYDVLAENPEFVMGIPTVDLINAVTLCGTKSGREVDKVEQLGLDLLPGTEIDVPLLADALGNIECRVDESFESGDVTYYFGDVEAVHVRPDAMNGRILSPSVGPLAYMGSDTDEDGEKHWCYLEYTDEPERVPDAAVEKAIRSSGNENG